MTRYPPQGPQSGEHPPGYYQPEPQQYGEGTPQYGGYSLTENQAYGQPQGYQQQPYGGEGPLLGQAQSYDGRPDQPYQQYPNEDPSQYGGRRHYQHSPVPPYSQAHTSHQYGEQSYQPHGQQYPPPYRGPEVEAFKSHFDELGPNPYGQSAPATYGQAGYPPNAAEPDRGLMGALAGGAAGAYGGHQIGHGVIGALGGAIGGSMLEDAVIKKKKKDKKQKKQKQKKRRGSSSSSSSSSSSDPSSNDEKNKKKKKHGKRVAMAGNFYASSRDVRLEHDQYLVAECADVNGHHHLSRIDLNDCLTNTNGALRWAEGGNFKPSARQIRLTDGGNALEAELGDGRGGWIHNKILLSEQITNDNGRLEMI